jgi:hypothetical protein
MITKERFDEFIRLYKIMQETEPNKVDEHDLHEYIVLQHELAVPLALLVKGAGEDLAILHKHLKESKHIGENLSAVELRQSVCLSSLMELGG